MMFLVQVQVDSYCSSDGCTDKSAACAVPFKHYFQAETVHFLAFVSFSIKNISV